MSARSWRVKRESHARRAHDSAFFFRSGRVCPTECFFQGHECERASPGFEANRSSGSMFLRDGMQLVVDISFRSAVSCYCEAHRHSADHDGAVLLQARQDKERHVPNSFFGTVQVCRVRHGDGWQVRAKRPCRFLLILAHSKARDAVPYMQFSVVFHVGKTVDANVGHRVRCLFRFFLGVELPPETLFGVARMERSHTSRNCLRVTPGRGRVVS